MRRKLRHWRLLAYALAGVSLTLGLPAAAGASGASYVALGDSYTSSPLTGESASGVPLSCLQSTNDYPHLVAAAIQAASLTDVSCSAATIANLTEPQTNLSLLGTNPPQFDALTPTTSLVTVGIGVNDTDIFSAAETCMVLDLLQATGSACADRYIAGGVDQISQAIDETAPKLAAAYQRIHALAPQARVLAVGYPAVFPVDGTGCWPLVSISPADLSFLASLLVQLNEMIATTAAANDVQYVDTYTPTIGHDVCRPDGLAGFSALLPSGISAPMHPNAVGSTLMANAVEQAIDDPPTPVPAVAAGADLKITKARIGRRRITASGTMSPVYHGRVTITFKSRYRGHAIDIRRKAKVTHGHFHGTLPIPRQYRRALRTGTLIATSVAEAGLTSGRARTQIR